MMIEILSGIAYVVDNTVLALIVFIAATFVHEFAHLRAARKHDPKAYIKVEYVNHKLSMRTLWNGTNLTRKDNRQIIQAGIIYGGVIILMGVLISPLMFLVFIPYAFGVNSDLKRLDELDDKVERGE